MRKSMGDKVYLTYEQQIEKLKRDGLIVDDERERSPVSNGKDIIISPSDIIGCSRTKRSAISEELAFGISRLCIISINIFAESYTNIRRVWNVT